MNNRVKTNYNNPSENGQSYMPNQYDYNDRGYTDSFYDEYEYVDSGAGSFLVGAIVGGVLGAAAALFLAPKTGKEMREDFTSQASQLKEKGIEIVDDIYEYLISDTIHNNQYDHKNPFAE